MTPLFLGGFNRLGVAWVLPGNRFSLRWLVRLRMGLNQLPLFVTNQKPITQYSRLPFGSLNQKPNEIGILNVNRSKSIASSDLTSCCFSESLPTRLWEDIEL